MPEFHCRARPTTVIRPPRNGAASSTLAQHRTSSVRNPTSKGTTQRKEYKTTSLSVRSVRVFPRRAEAAVARRLQLALRSCERRARCTARTLPGGHLPGCTQAMRIMAVSRWPPASCVLNLVAPSSAGVASSATGNQ